MIEKTYIAENGCLINRDIKEFIESKIQNGSMIIISTEKFECSEQKRINDIEHLLEVRVFTGKKELKISRPTISDGFAYRIIEDDKLCKDDYIDEAHFLDINDKLYKEGSYDYVATGGGKYTLPIADARKVLIRNYVSYDNQGIAQITDFRVVKYLRKGDF